VTDHLSYFADVMPTLAEASGARLPEGLDGISFLPTLLGRGEQRRHEFLYWEYGGQVAVRKGDWKAYKSGKQPWRLFNVKADTLEERDLAKERPDVLEEMVAYARSAHVPATPGGWIDRARAFTRPRKKPRKR
jgi:arylsulfatase A-like enzyme